MEDSSKGKQQQLHHQQREQQQQQHGVIQSPASNHNIFMEREAAAYDLGELDQALLLYLDGQDQSTLRGERQTLDIFPSRPMNAAYSNNHKDGNNLLTSSPDASDRIPEDGGKELAAIRRSGPSTVAEQTGKNLKATYVKREREANKKGAASASEREGAKALDSKTLRRLAQNREAAKKSRLRKKAYVQQLESSRMRLLQLEQEIQRAKAQGVFYGAVTGDQGLLTTGGMGGMSSEAAVFDMEYGRWVEEHHRRMCELRTVLQQQYDQDDGHQQQQQQQQGRLMEEEGELRVLVDGCLAHYDELSGGIKSAAIATDVFHLVSATWVSPAERCFFWMGGFRPSHIIKIISRHVDATSEQQFMGICGLQQSIHETEEALSQGLDALHRSLSDTIASEELNSASNMADYMTHMALAVNKLSTLEDFVRQAESLRQQTLHRLHQLLSARQAARCYLAIAEYFHRLRGVSSLWLTRPRLPE